MSEMVANKMVHTLITDLGFFMRHDVVKYSICAKLQVMDAQMNGIE